jgi:hypothetical protein
MCGRNGFSMSGELVVYRYAPDETWIVERVLRRGQVPA